MNSTNIFQGFCPQGQCNYIIARAEFFFFILPKIGVSWCKFGKNKLVISVNNAYREKNYRSNSIQEFIKRESWLLMIIVDRKKILSDCYYLCFDQCLRHQLKLSRCLKAVIHIIDKIDACFLCFFQQILRQNESFLS